MPLPLRGARTGRPKIRGCAVAGCDDSDAGKLTAALRAKVGMPPSSSKLWCTARVEDFQNAS